MTYTLDHRDLSEGPPGFFTIVVDDKTMTWKTDPPGKKVKTPMLGAFLTAKDGKKGRKFDLLQGGKAREAL
jgi:hypothetical protein